MNAPNTLHTDLSITREMLVADVLARWPQVAPVFFHRHMYCVGCSMNRFETLAEVASIYRLDLESFLADLRAGADSGPGDGVEYGEEMR